MPVNSLKSRILACKTPNDLNSLRLLIVQDKANFAENQKTFRRVMNRFKRTPMKSRPKEWGRYYDPEITQKLI